MTAKIFDIKHFAVHDGPGIRTTVFFKGCPLKCVWCHNPEGISPQSQMSFVGHKCVDCARCIEVCPTGAHMMSEGKHTFDRSKCILCGNCTKTCFAKALYIYGREIDADTLMTELLEDKDFYDSSNGGVTLSGGECLVQADFCAEILKKLHENGVHTAVDTCGFVSRDAIDKVLEYTDLFLYDLKAIDTDVHIKCTSQPNQIILDNLEYIDSKGKSIEIRYPYVPEWNSSEAEKIAKHIKSLKNVTEVKILPYHNYSFTKYASLDMENTMPDTLPNDDEISAVKALFLKYGLNVGD